MVLDTEIRMLKSITCTEAKARVSRNWVVSVKTQKLHELQLLGKDKNGVFENRGRNGNESGETGANMI